MFVNWSYVGGSDCYGFPESTVLLNVFMVSRTAVTFPVAAFVLRYAYRQWRPTCSFQTCSHSDVLTYNMVLLELIWLLVLVMHITGLLWSSPAVVSAYGFFIISLILGQTGFHILGCEEHYMAVVHPLIYRKFKDARGVRIRNLLISAVWVVSLLLGSVLCYDFPKIPFIPVLMLQVIPLALISITSVAVLSVLIRPAPGKEGRDKAAFDQSKKKALFTILAILGVLWFSLMGFLVPMLIEKTQLIDPMPVCVLMSLGYWAGIPSSLVQPLLYLRRVKATPCCR